MSNYCDEEEACCICGVIDNYDSLVMCQNKHMFCREHILPLKKEDLLLQKLKGESVNAIRFTERSTHYDYDKMVRKEYCPICQMEKFLDYQLLNYAAALLSSDGTLETFKKEVREKFHSDYDDFLAEIDKNQKERMCQINHKKS